MSDAEAGTAYIGIGANLGDAVTNVSAAIETLARIDGVTLMQRSSLYRTAPVAASGPAFVNAVVKISTSFSPTNLLVRLQAIEQAHGRQRPFPNAPRTLDLDLLLFTNAAGRMVALETEGLVLPHPRMHQRAFVLVPLLEIAPDIELPGHGEASSLLKKITDQSVTKLPA